MPRPKKYWIYWKKRNWRIISFTGGEPLLNPDVYKIITYAVDKGFITWTGTNGRILSKEVLRPEIFSALESLLPGTGGEIQLTDGPRALNRSQAVQGYSFQGKRYDGGDKLGFIKANVEFALNRHDLRQEFIGFLDSLAKQQYEL